MLNVGSSSGHRWVIRKHGEEPSSIGRMCWGVIWVHGVNLTVRRLSPNCLLRLVSVAQFFKIDLLPRIKIVSPELGISP